MRQLLVAIISTAAAAALASGCSGTTPERSTSDIEAEPEAEAERSAPPAADACAVHAAEFRRAMARATGQCSADTDCGCFDPVVGEAGCGGITDRATADRLQEIERAFHASSCPWPHQCGPWRCEPVCRDGRCVNSQPGGYVLP